MEYKGFTIVHEYVEPMVGAWRAYMTDDPEVVVDGRTLEEVQSEINDIVFTRELLSASVQYETIKTHLRNMMGAMDEFMGREELLDPDTASQYLAAAKFCNSEFGTSYRTHHVEEWIENELNKLK